MFTPQETYDHVAVALVKQGRPSLQQGKYAVVCCYFADNGDRCAAGHCFEWDGDWRYEGETAGHPEVTRRIVTAGHDAKIVRELQQAHDSAINRDNWLPSWVSLMRIVAAKRHLSTLALDAALAQAGVNA